VSPALRAGLTALAACLALYGLALLALLAAGRRLDARALARFVPDCLVLVRRLLGDPRVSRGRKLLLGALLAYLLMPLDLVPDFLPVVGQLDDVVLVALALRALVRGADGALLAGHWPGPPEGLRVLLRVAGAAAPRARQPEESNSG